MLCRQRIGQFWNPTNAGHPGTADAFICTTSLRNSRIICWPYRITPEILRQRLKFKSVRFSLHRDLQIKQDSLTDGMKSTSIRFKVSVLMKVLIHRHHQSAKLRNQQSGHLPQAGSDPELFLQREHTLPNAASKVAAAPSTPPASISKTPVAVHSSFTPTTSLCRLKLPKLQCQSVVVEDNKERIRTFFTNGLNQQNSEVGKLASKSEVSHSSSCPQPLCHGWEKLRTLEECTISLLQHPRQESQNRISRILSSRLQRESGNPDRKLQENKSPQQKAKLNQRRDKLRADRLLG